MATSKTSRPSDGTRQRVVAGLASLLLVACGGTTATEDSNDGGSAGASAGAGDDGSGSRNGGAGGINGGTGSTIGGSSSGDSGMGGEAVDTGGAAGASTRLYPLCESHPENYPLVEPSDDAACAELDAFTLSALGLENSPADTTVSPGEEVRVDVSYVLSGENDFNVYPCAGIMADHPDVAFPDGDWPNHSVAYSIAPGGTLGTSKPVTFASSMAPGTVVHFITWVTAQGSNCIRSVEELAITVE
jgi:hypothetical protein